MKLGKLSIKNFGAYKNLDFDFDNQGLCLISGPTKAGKSTILDAVCWILYGTTSKDSAADDMRSWFADGEETEGSLEVYTATEMFTVYRTRGKPSENDLCWVPSGYLEDPERGKDLKDTQKLLDEKLGVNAELFIVGSYMHQFSNADTFFIAKAKDRREVLEKLADLSLPVKLGSRSSEARKVAKKDLEELQRDKAKLEGKLEQTEKSRSAASVAWEKYETQRALKITSLEDSAENFETERRAKVSKMVDKIEELMKMEVSHSLIDDRMNQVKLQIKALEQAKIEYKTAFKKQTELESKYKAIEDERTRLTELHSSGSCPTCTSPLESNRAFDKLIDDTKSYHSDLTIQLNTHTKHFTALEAAISIEKKLHAAYDKCRDDKVNNDKISKEIEDLNVKLIVSKSEVNRHKESIAALKSEANPYETQIQDADIAIEDLKAEISRVTSSIVSMEHMISSLTWLYDKSFELRAAMLERAKNEIAHKTNEYLEKYFDAELRIKLTFEGSDKLNVDIMNESYSCPYKQLSGGERCMLKLAFNLSLMKRAEDVAGIKFSTIMMDEALNGLDATLKTKAFNLLQSLENEYSTILLIDHFEEFKSLFSNQFHVTKENGYSVLQNEES